ncbi:MAG: lamin tail domain-containing protein [Phycisphaerae bacterium]|nr:lamin tail domain-containing protein [Phycisphaerae bacterium]
MSQCFCAVFLCILWSQGAAAQEIPLLLNELLASNDTVVRDPQGEFEDWLELVNLSDAAFDAAGLYLTDDVTDPMKWQIPTGLPALTTVPARGYLVVWLDNDGGDSGLHANFKLSASGERVALYAADGMTLVDEVVFGSQVADVSFGRYPNAGAYWRQLAQPTPGAENHTLFLGEVADTRFSFDRGFYTEPNDLVLSCNTLGAVIIYTLDGSEPYYPEEDDARSENGIVYTGPIRIDKTTVLRAAAFKPGYKPSNVDTQTYVFVQDVTSQPAAPEGFPVAWAAGKSDYEMDPEVTQDVRYKDKMADALLSLPTLSIVADVQDLFGEEGIYANPVSSGQAWERGVSAEWIQPDGQEEFHVNCGLRIDGTLFRQPVVTMKHSLRLLFKSIYGPARLDFPLLGDEGATSFDTVILRAGESDSYAWDGARFTEQYIRDEFARRLQGQTGQASARGRFVHVYLNGLYWGVYNVAERPDEDFSAEAYGGNADDWDVLYDQGEVGNAGAQARQGDFEAWNQMLSMCKTAGGSFDLLQRVQGLDVDGLPLEGVTPLLDLDNYVDYLIVNLWSGHWDWPWKNWWAARDTSDQTTGFKFYTWGSENSMGNSRDRSPMDKNALYNDFSGVGLVHRYLMPNEEYRLRFADRIQRLFFANGPLTEQALHSLYDDLAGQVESAIIAESARWGDMHHDAPLVQEDWLVERDWMFSLYMKIRSDIVLDQFEKAGLYPMVQSPVFAVNGVEQRGGLADVGDVLTLDSMDGIVYYTLDGSDPHLAGVEAGPPPEVEVVTLLEESAPKLAFVPFGEVDEAWKGGAAFDDSGWAAGTGGVGYEWGTDFVDYIGIDVMDDMFVMNSTCLIRIPFDLTTDPSQLESLILKIRYDDGFVAFVNGLEVARANAPDDLVWNASAAQAREDAAELTMESFTISVKKDMLHSGLNILAIQGLNNQEVSTDFLISAMLEGVKAGEGTPVPMAEGAMKYEGPVTLTKTSVIRARALKGQTWSAINEAVFAVGPVFESLRVSEVMYNPMDSNLPQDPNREFIELTNVGQVSVNLSGVALTQGVDFVFPDYDLAPGARILVVRDLAAFEATYGPDLPVVGQYAGNLNNNGERITLQDAVGRILQSFSYKDGWIEITDGMGFSLTAVDPGSQDGYALDNKSGWRASSVLGGTPGYDDSDQAMMPGTVTINEILANAGVGQSDWVELKNNSNVSVAVGGWYLSDGTGDFMKYRIADGTVIAPGGYLVLTQTLHFGNAADPGSASPFGLNANGEVLYLHGADQNGLNGYTDEVDFGASDQGVSLGRVSGDNMVPLQSTTPGSPNALPVQ